MPYVEATGAKLYFEESGSGYPIADSARCRPPFRNDLAHRSDFDLAHHSEMISPAVPR